MENNWLLLRFCSRRRQDGLSWRQRMGNRGSRDGRDGHGRWHRIRPFFCQMETAETAIWLTEVASELGKRGNRFTSETHEAKDPFRRAMP
jgi:hypothetical protein